MNWLSPNFLFAVAAIVLPLALHLLRRRVVRSQPFPSLRFLAATRDDQRHQKIRRRVVLALRCLALALLAAAFARPFFGETPEATTRATVVVIDNSFSLQAGTRWNALRGWARAQIGPITEGDSLGLLLMNPSPTWLITPTRDINTALIALDRLEPGWETTRAEPAMRLAADVLANTPARERRLVLLGDHQSLGWNGTDFLKKLPPGVVPVFADPSPAPERQAALTQARLNHDDAGWSVAVTVRNFTARQKRTVSLYSETSHAPLQSMPVELPAGESVTLKLALPASVTVPPAFVRVALDADDLPADNTLWVVAPAASGEHRLLLDRLPANGTADHLGTAYAALAAQPPALRVAPTPDSAWPVTAAAILRTSASFSGEAGGRLDAFLAAGGSAFFLIDGGTAQRDWLAAHGIKLRAVEAKPARLRDWALDHPLVIPLAEHNLRSLVGWEFSRAWSLPAEVMEPLAYWADGSVALGECRLGAGRVLIAGFTAERRDGDWPVQTAFVPFLHRTASYLFGQTAATQDAPPRVGVTLAQPQGPGTWSALAGPAVAALKSSKAPLTERFTPTAPGVYAFTPAAGPRHLYPVGLAEDESELSPWPAGTPWKDLISPEKAPATPLSVRQADASADAERHSSLGWWAFVGLAIFALAELGLANRTSR